MQKRLQKRPRRPLRIAVEFGRLVEKARLRRVADRVGFMDRRNGRDCDSGQASDALQSLPQSAFAVAHVRPEADESGYIFSMRDNASLMRSTSTVKAMRK